MTTVRRTILVATCLLLVACQQDQGPDIVIRDVEIYAPVPGSMMGVAYFVIDNNGGDLITLEAARSPQFDAVEIHETRSEDGVSRMRPVAAVDIAAGESAHFQPGGKHLMLVGPGEGVGAGSSVTIELEHSAGLLLVNATMRARLPTN
jgi:copper(I)-binding protein